MVMCNRCKEIDAQCEVLLGIALVLDQQRWPSCEQAPNIREAVEKIREGLCYCDDKREPL